MLRKKLGSVGVGFELETSISSGKDAAVILD